MNHRRAELLLVTGLYLSILISLRAENWPQWRGPHFNGSSAEKGLPVTFNKSDGVRWAAPLPGPSGATPVVWGEYVFVSSVDELAKTCVALAFNRQTGRERWRLKVAEGMG